MEVREYLAEYYASHDEHSCLASKSGNVEFFTTMTYIEKYLKQGMRIIEIGAGTGRYSHALARKGFQVDAVELMEHNIEIFKENTIKNEPVTITQGNATNLSAFESDAYDVTLLLGPMYHLFTEEEKLKALSEAIRVTKKGGTVFAAYVMGDAAILSYGFIKGAIWELMEKHMIDPVTFDTFSEPWDIFEMYRKEDIDRLMSRFDVKRLHFITTDGQTRLIKETVDKMDDKTYEMYLKYHLAICERQDMTGCSNHTLDIFTKE